ncbi:MAG: hypothetical protein MUQ25_04620 [Candidatus Aminicenantes bacterium]|nr:hypothetical protein [Candidatus Aminicenantes bacterium]
MDKTAKNGSVLMTQAGKRKPGKLKKISGNQGFFGGGADQDRTGDLLHAMQSLLVWHA